MSDDTPEVLSQGLDGKFIPAEQAKDEFRGNVNRPEEPTLAADELFTLLRQTLGTYGTIFDHVAVTKVKFEVEEWVEVIDLDGPSGWKVTASLTGYGELKVPVPPSDEEPEPKLADMDPEQTYEREWVGTGSTLPEALTAIRALVTEALEGIVAMRRSEVDTASQALSTIKRGVVLDEMWEAPPKLDDPENRTEEENARVAAQDGQLLPPPR